QRRLLRRRPRLTPGRAAMRITRTSINQPVFTTMVMQGIVVLGIFSYARLPVEQMPDVSAPYVFIQVEYPGASPEAIENDIIKPVENAITSVDGIRRIYATMTEGRGGIQVEFRLDVDIASATQEIRDKVAMVRPTFPRDAKDPLITRSFGDENQSPI